MTRRGPTFRTGDVARAVLAALTLGVSAWGAVVTGNALLPYELARPKLLSLPPLTEMDTRVIDVLSMGHRGLYDDFINIWAIQILMDEELRKASPDDVAAALGKITRHGPKLESLYMLTCFMLSIDFKRDDLCLPFTMDGLNAFPESWKIPMTQGAILAFRMKKPAEAAPFFKLASLRPKAPPYLASLAKRLESQDQTTTDEIQRGLEYLDELPGGQRLRESLLEEEIPTIGPTAPRGAQP